MNIQQTATYQYLREEIDRIPAIASHDHLRRESDILHTTATLFDIMVSGIIWVDMVSAGLPVLEKDKGMFGPPSWPRPQDVEEIWAHIRPYLDHVRECATWNAHWRGITELFDFHEELTDSNWRELNKRIMAAQKPGYYYEVMRKRGNVEACLLDREWTYARTEPADRFYSVNVMRVMEWTDLYQEFRQKGAAGGKPIETLDDAIADFEARLAQLQREGVIALKMGQAYWRSLEFDDVPRAEAERLFPRLDQAGWTPKPVQDFMMNYIVRRAGEEGLPVAFHTGYQYGTGNDIRNARAQLLMPMIRRNPRTRFDIYHISYPYCEEAMMLAKYFPNVYFDFCFSDYLSPTKVVDLLHIGLELLPSNKMFGWGADSGLVECHYGSLCTTRDCIARALAERVEAGQLTRDRAVVLMRKLMRDNVAEMYRLDEWRAKFPE